MSLISTAEMRQGLGQPRTAQSVYKCAPVRCGSVLPHPTVTTATSSEETARTGANGREWDANGDPRPHTQTVHKRVFK